MIADPLYFPREKLAEILLSSLQENIAHAYLLFAPRRMGKTQFLLNDVAPQAGHMGFNVFYFSFMDDDPATIGTRFQSALYQFAQHAGKAESAKTFIGSLKKIDIMGVGIERDIDDDTPPISTIINSIAAAARPTLLLLDEAQELARIKNTDGLIRALRTGLDINQSRVKTIFTGSSTNGLRAMFNDSKAPFFHFAHAMDFPVLGQEFTDFMAEIYQQRTGQSLSRAALYQAFERLNKTPLYMRAMIQDMIINPALSIDEAAAIRLEHMHESSDYARLWRDLGALERLILQQCAKGETGFYSAAKREEAAAFLGINNISTSTMQGNIRKLERKDLITRNAGGGLQINSPLLQTWIIENTF